jgi:hypothetical protein
MFRIVPGERLSELSSGCIPNKNKARFADSWIPGEERGETFLSQTLQVEKIAEGSFYWK